MVSTRAACTVVNMEALRQDIEKLSTTLTKRLDDLEKTVTASITAALVEHIDRVKDELNRKINGLIGRIEKLEDEANLARSDDLSCNFVLFELAEEENENVEARVNILLKDELKLVDTTIQSAERKPSYHGRNCGVIVVKCKNSVDKSKVMKAKASLNNSANFKHIRIYHDKPKWQRLHEANMRQIVKTVGANKLIWRNNRLFEADGRQNEWNRGIDGGRGLEVAVEVAEVVVKIKVCEVVMEISNFDGNAGSGTSMAGHQILAVTNIKFGLGH